MRTCRQLLANERRLRSSTVVGDTKPLHGAHEHACLDLMRERFHVTPIVRLHAAPAPRPPVVITVA